MMFSGGNSEGVNNMKALLCSERAVQAIAAEPLKLLWERADCVESCTHVGSANLAM
jgi:hypothetical protein